MPKGPREERRPADLIGAAVTVGRVSVGDVEEKLSTPSGRIRSGYAGAKARADALSEKRRKEIAKSAGKARWDD
jgi:hypothetical protein